MLCEASCALQRPAKIDHALGLDEAEGSMHGMRLCVLQRRVRGELGATLRPGPGFDGCDESARYTGAPRGGLDVQPFEKCDWRAARAVDVVDPLRCFHQADARAIRGDGE